MAAGAAEPPQLRRPVGRPRWRRRLAQCGVAPRTAGATAATTDPEAQATRAAGAAQAPTKGAPATGDAGAGEDQPADSRPVQGAAIPRSQRDREEAREQSAGSTKSGRDGDVEVALEEQAQVAQEFLTQLTAEFGVQADVEVFDPMRTPSTCTCGEAISAC